MASGLESELERLTMFNRKLQATHQRMNGMWLPEQRTRYKSKRRRLDLEMIGELWQLPDEVMAQTINLADVPAKVQKKYRRALIVHGEAWKRKDSKSTLAYERLPRDKQGEHLLTNSRPMLEVMGKILPTYQSKMITDIPTNFRDSEGGWYRAEDKGVTIVRFWNTYRIATVLANRDKPAESLRFVDEALSLIPPLKKGDMPNKWEVMMRVYRAYAKYDLGDYEAALNENRMCLAAIRLLAFHGKVDMSDSNDILMSKANGMGIRIMRCLMHIKLNNGVQRPLFSAEERLDLMEELSFGMYSTAQYKCHCCKKTNPEVKLSLCSGCSGVWYCGKECSKKGWKDGHKQYCGRSMFSSPAEGGGFLEKATSIDGVDKTDGFSIVTCFLTNNYLIMCKGEESGEYFDALTDNSFGKKM